MADVDVLVKKQLVDFRAKVINVLKEKHPYVIGMAESFMSGRKNRFGMQVLDNGTVAGEYTLILDGIHIASVDDGLSPEFQHPLFGAIKPYVVINREVLEQAVQNEEFLADTFAAAKKILPNITIRFLPVDGQ